MKQPEEPIVITLLGKKRYTPKLPLKYRIFGGIFLFEAKKRYERHRNERYTIWYGRMLAYKNRFEEAFKIYGEGIAKYPNSYLLHRHRGHRYISTYQPEKAMADLDMAAQLFEKYGDKNEWETDGITHRLPIPPEKVGFQIYYHQGLTHYYNQDYEGALECYAKCENFLENDDDIVACTYWQYSTLRRMGKEAEAKVYLARVHDDMKFEESNMYFKPMCLAQGKMTPEELMKIDSNDSYQKPIDYGSLMYALGNYYFYNGEPEKAKQIWSKMIEEADGWAAFGVVAAEIDLIKQFDFKL